MQKNLTQCWVNPGENISKLMLIIQSFITSNWVSSWERLDVFCLGIQLVTNCLTPWSQPPPHWLSCREGVRRQISCRLYVRTYLLARYLHVCFLSRSITGEKGRVANKKWLPAWYKQYWRESYQYCVILLEVMRIISHSLGYIWCWRIVNSCLPSL